MTEDQAQLAYLSARIVASYVGHNNLPRAELFAFIATTHAALQGVADSTTAKPIEAPEVPLVPAVSIKKSITPNAIICLEDGKAFKTLKRHLSSKYNLTPEQYRAKWKLPPDYPMVAPNYAQARSNLAKAAGLGRKAAPMTAIRDKPAAAKRATRSRKVEA